MAGGKAPNYFDVKLALLVEPAAEKDMRSVTRTFPYLVFYALETNTIHILAVIHAAQNPDYIAERLGI